RRDSADLGALSSQIAARIDGAIESLPEMQRVVARLFLVEEFEHAEIARMTGLTEGTVRSHLSLARKKLREELADVYGGSDE
ncbi:MAG TPA: sigma-70 family RNA polymerase sigma factor, partial [Thermoanaerobaculia bacterium]|nr:sigma-70 family RNA polymerase sigma factor [Thermoanaerobaculia bacterium]